MGSDETLFGLLPVDDAPDVFEVLGPGILVVDIVGVLPDVDADDGHDVRAHVRDWILVVCDAERKSVLALVVNEPAPARALDGGCARVEHLDEAVDGAPTFNDCVE